MALRRFAFQENDFFVLPRCDELLSPSATKPQLLPLHAGVSWLQLQRFWGPAHEIP
jgi:hypothetical protein